MNIMPRLELPTKPKEGLHATRRLNNRLRSLITAACLALSSSAANASCPEPGFNGEPEWWLPALGNFNNAPQQIADNQMLLFGTFTWTQTPPLPHVTNSAAFDLAARPKGLTQIDYTYRGFVTFEGLRVQNGRRVPVQTTDTIVTILVFENGPFFTAPHGTQRASLARMEHGALRLEPWLCSGEFAYPRQTPAQFDQLVACIFTNDCPEN